MGQFHTKHANIKNMLTVKHLFVNIVQFLRLVYSFLLSSQRCIVCQQENCGGICVSCANELFFIPLKHKIEQPQQYCSLCSRPLICEDEVCIACKRLLKDEDAPDKHSLTLARKTLSEVAFFPYVDKYVDIVLQWKNRDVRSISAILAYSIAQYIRSTPSLQGCPIVPVPPRPQKLKTKGWDQIEDVCSSLETTHNIKIARLLSRKDGHTQKGLGETERKANVDGKFYIKRKLCIWKTLIKKTGGKAKEASFDMPKKVILLDDVLTTGATMNACTQALKNAGCEDVISMILFFN